MIQKGFLKSINTVSKGLPMNEQTLLPLRAHPSSTDGVTSEALYLITAS